MSASVPDICQDLDAAMELLGAEQTVPEGRELAEQTYERALRDHGRGHPLVGQARMVLAEAHIQGDDYIAAERQARKAVPLLEQGYGGQHPLYIEALLVSGRAMALRKDAESAAEAFARAGESLLACLEQGAVNAEQVGCFLGLVDSLGRQELGVPVAELLSRRAPGEDEQWVDELRLEALAVLGIGLFRQSRLDEAEPVLQRAAAEATRRGEPKREIGALGLLAALASAAGDPDRGAALVQRAVELAMEQFPDAAERAGVLFEMGEAHLALGAEGPAEALFEQSVEEQMSAGGTLDVDQVPARQHLYVLCMVQQRHADALAHLRRSAAIGVCVAEADDPGVAEMLARMVELHSALGGHGDAIALLTEELELASAPSLLRIPSAHGALDLLRYEDPWCLPALEHIAVAVTGRPPRRQSRRQLRRARRRAMKAGEPEIAWQILKLLLTRWRGRVGLYRCYILQECAKKIGHERAYRELAALLDKAEELDFDAAGLHYVLGKTALELCDWDALVQHNRWLQQHRPRLSTMEVANDLAYGLANRGSDLEEAEAIVRQQLRCLHRLRPARWFGARNSLLDTLGLALLRQGRSQEALPLLQQAYAGQTDIIHGMHLAHASHACGRVDEARALFATIEDMPVNEWFAIEQRRLKRCCLAAEGDPDKLFGQPQPAEQAHCQTQTVQV